MKFEHADEWKLCCKFNGVLLHRVFGELGTVKSSKSADGTRFMRFSFSDALNNTLVNLSAELKHRLVLNLQVLFSLHLVNLLVCPFRVAMEY
ncbi:hypothetical protein CDAR_179021 [Caerostris darwini]|uniref:Uncharacterized protein n=1 Tax=Caerostris darwini TaxID=1538125 RepID=A0AAV4P9A9_9ARAC|nr:hypothetical protein CDAR_179021 [Caerostris darwini]